MTLTLVLSKWCTSWWLCGTAVASAHIASGTICQARRLAPTLSIAVTSLLLAGACRATCPRGYVRSNDVCVVPQSDGALTAGESASGGAPTAGGNSAPSNSGPASGASSGPSQLGAGAAGAGSSTSAVSADPCEGKPQGSFCNGAAMLHCNASGQTLSADTCENAMFCAVGHVSGKCATCSPGTFRCTGTMLEACGDDGQYSLAKNCDSAALCKETAGDCTTQLCTPNTKVCGPDGTLSTCNSEGTALTAPEPCGAGMCDMKLGQCYKCVPNTVSCMGDELSECSPDGQTQQLTACPAAECKIASCLDGQCVSEPAPARTKCASANLCDDSNKCVGCLTNADCDLNELCSSGMCVVKACSPNMAVCTSSGVLQICDATGSMVAETMPCGPKLCDQAGRGCYNCAPNERSCRGDTAIACPADGSRATETKCAPRGDDCTTASCDSSTGQCSSGVRPAGSSCSKGKCNSSGECVPCLTGDTMTCTDVPNGQCGPGKKTCQSNAWSTCIGTKVTDDVCGGGDTDCDGKTDETCTGMPGRKCQGSQSTECAISGDFGGCTQCSQSGKTLTCSCPNGQSKVASTTVDLSSCGTDDPVNCSGQLSCMDCWQLILKQGSFDESNDQGVVSCEQCTYNYKSVNCQCRKKDGTLVAASTYDLPCPGGLWNDDGMLKCSGK